MRSIGKELKVAIIFVLGLALGPMEPRSAEAAQGIGSDALSAFVLDDAGIHSACRGDLRCEGIYLRVRAIAMQYRSSEDELAEALAQQDVKCGEATSQASCLEAARAAALKAKAANERLSALAREAEAELAHLGAVK